MRLENYTFDELVQNGRDAVGGYSWYRQRKLEARKEELRRADRWLIGGTLAGLTGALTFASRLYYSPVQEITQLVRDPVLIGSGITTFLGLIANLTGRTFEIDWLYDHQ